MSGDNHGEHSSDDHGAHSSGSKKGFSALRISLIAVVVVLIGIAISLRACDGAREEKSSGAAQASPTASAPVRTSDAVDRCSAAGVTYTEAPTVRNAADISDAQNWAPMVRGIPGCTLGTFPHPDNDPNLRIRCVLADGTRKDFRDPACRQQVGEEYGSNAATPIQVISDWTKTGS